MTTTCSLSLTRWPRTILRLETAGLEHDDAGTPRLCIELGGGIAPELPDNLSAAELFAEWRKCLTPSERLKVQRSLFSMARTLDEAEDRKKVEAMLTRYLSMSHRRRDALQIGTPLSCQITHDEHRMSRFGPADLGTKERHLSDVLELITNELPRAVRYHARPVEAAEVVASARDAAAVYRNALVMFRFGMPYGSIARAVKIPEGTLRGWMVDHRLPPEIADAARVARSAIEASRRMIAAPSPALARLLGMFVASTEVGVVPNQIRLTSMTRQRLKAPSELIFEITGDRVKPEKILVGSTVMYQVRYFNHDLLQTICDTTDGFTSVPFAALGTDDERSEFIGGFLDSRSSIQCGPKLRGIRVEKSGGQSMLVGLALLLRRIGVHPNLVLTGKEPRLEIFDTGELKVVASEIALRDPEKSRALKTLSERQGERNGGTPDDFDRAMTLTKQGMPLPEIAADLELSRDTVRAWLQRGAIPRSVGRRDAVDDACRDYPQPDIEVVARLVRELRVAPRTANRLGRFVSLQEFVSRIGYRIAALRGQDEEVERLLLGS